VSPVDVSDAIAEACADEYERLRDSGASPAAAYRGSLVVLHERRARQRETAEAPRLTVEAVVAEPDPETLAEIITGGQRG
jgi:hypothetical protein